MRLQKLVYDPYDDRDMTDNPTGLLLRTHSDVDCLKSIPREKVACVDLETTGVNPGGNDEILQVSICDGSGNVLLNSYVRPEHRKRWPKAQEVNHITWAMVKDAPSLEELAVPIEEIFSDCELLIGYNILRFDIPFLSKARINVPRGKQVYDLMYDCSVLHGRWSEYHVNYSFVKLESVAKIYGIEYDAHDSVNDAIATTKLFYALLDGDAMTEKIDYYEQKVAERLEREEAERQRKEAELQELHENLIAAQEKSKTGTKTKEQEEKERNGHNAVMGVYVVLILVLVMMLVTCGGMCSR